MHCKCAANRKIGPPDPCREYTGVIRHSTSEHYPALSGRFGSLQGLDVLPKATGRRLPLLVVGSAQQSRQWIARHLDG